MISPFVVVGGWTVYHVGRQGKAVGLNLLVTLTINNYLFWIGCVLVFLVCHFAFRTV